jgi:hypothetical protein
MSLERMLSEIFFVERFGGGGRGGGGGGGGRGAAGAGGGGGWAPPVPLTIFFSSYFHSVLQYTYFKSTYPSPEQYFSLHTLRVMN